MFVEGVKEKKKRKKKKKKKKQIRKKRKFKEKKFKILDAWIEFWILPKKNHGKKSSLDHSRNTLIVNFLCFLLCVSDNLVYYDDNFDKQTKQMWIEKENEMKRKKKSILKIKFKNWNINNKWIL